MATRASPQRPRPRCRGACAAGRCRPRPRAGRRSPCGSRGWWRRDPRPPARCAPALAVPGIRRSVLCSCRPVANSRWMTWSCRSRAIRSRSSSTSSCRCALLFSASSRASVACSANEVSSGTSVGWNVSLPANRKAVSTPITESGVCSGTASERAVRLPRGAVDQHLVDGSVSTGARPATTSVGSGCPGGMRCRGRPRPGHAVRRR